MTRILVLTFEGGGNVPPVLGTVADLVQAGAEVRVLTEPCLEQAVAATRAEFAALTGPIARTDRQAPLMRDWEHRFPPKALKDTLDRVMFGPIVEIVRQVRAECARFSPDMIVTDWLMPAGIMAAEAERLPCAVLMHCTDMRPAPGRPAAGMAPASGPLGLLRDRLLHGAMERLVDGSLDKLNAARHEHGLPAVSHAFDLFDRADRVLVQTGECFDFPLPDRFPNTLYTGPVLDDPDWACTAWDAPWAANDPRPLVVASLSSTYQRQEKALQAILHGLGQLEDVRALVTRGPAMRDTHFDIPDGVILQDHVPHAAVLPEASAFISHCGHGSAMRSLTAGVPLLCLPMGRDQGDVAARIVHRGAGLKARPSPRAIAKGVRRLVDDPRFADAAATLGAELKKAARGRRAASEILQLAPIRECISARSARSS